MCYFAEDDLNKLWKPDECESTLPFPNKVLVVIPKLPPFDFSAIKSSLIRLCVNLFVVK